MATLFSSTTHSLPILSIISYYILSALPHMWAVYVAVNFETQDHDNVSPKSSTYNEKLRKKLSAKDFAAFERAESCHRNHLENMPLYVAAVFAGYLAEARLATPGVGGLTAAAAKEMIGLETFVVGWMTIRVLYTMNYLTTETRVWSYVRSLLYFAGTGWAFVVLGRAAKALV